MKRRVFINADDIGLSCGVTDTILQVVDAGAIDGVSIIANGEALSYALAELHKRPQLRSALHANLTEGRALTPAHLLTTPDGFFRYSPLRLWLRYLCALPSTRALLRAQVRGELIAQHIAVGSTERVDGHQHVHMVPFVFDELIALSGVRRVRLTREPLYIAPGTFSAFLRRALPVFGLSLLAFRNQHKAMQKGISTNDYCIGVLYSGEITRSSIASGIARTKGEVELIVHPGSAGPQELQEWKRLGGDVAWHISREREKERMVLLAPRFKNVIITSDHSQGRFFRFVISGTVSALVHMSVFSVLLLYGVWYITATTVGFCIAFIVSFSLQKRWTFKNTETDRTHRQFVAYLALQIGNVCLNAGGMYILVQICKVPPLPALIIVLILLAFFTYMFSSILFGKRVVQTHLEHLIEIVPDMEGRQVLDVGAGRGAFLIDCAKRGVRAKGIEYNPTNISIAESRASDAGVSIVIQQGRAEKLPYADGSFEFVNLCEVIEHVENPRKVLSELARVLAPEGKGYISVPNRFGWYDPHFHLPFVNWLPRRFADTYIALRGRHKEYQGESGEQRLSQMHYYTFGAFVREVQRAGLTLEDARVCKLRLRFHGLLLRLLLCVYYLARSWYFRTFHVLVTKPSLHV